MICHVHAAGTIELFFYGELPSEERAAVTAHLRQCPQCRAALEDLTIIRSALASRPDVATPPGGDWSGFMARLERAVRAADHPAETAPPSSHRGIMPAGRSLAPYLAMAALLALVTISVLVVRGRDARAPQLPEAAQAAQPSAAGRAPVSADPALASLSDQHFERSKLVVLGLATRDTRAPDASDWRYERELASTLLNDTRLYRLAAEERGMKALAGVMRDLELVLLQTSMAEHEDSESLEQLQRLIRRRDLITKMNVSYTEP